ncbi:DUF2268 domain-containing protein [Rossellomorea sp. YZS02]|uniref:DUF2268 domain-containing protein n=1 Tax=Rossellomorea sp. YZS02 TaxID=3097358 RepID=UPI002A12F7AE|nr:DUF2268 domain-containing putative Zn-dependent protease [Rossellomorea sp. YZS02]MDX8346312.1 DUF2268 domain-containing putative Zn-dependent protease [Rossellomorea sp. YZS02]
MAVVPTDNWLAEWIDNPLDLLKKTKNGKDDQQSFYQYLMKHGMYRSSRLASDTYEKMKEKKLWDRFALFEQKYKRKWNGPSVPIYLFPVQEKRGMFQSSMKKSGVCFKDEIFFFVTDQEDPKEYEALFVHEYHHCVRMKRLNKKDAEYTLLDSIIFEGLAENAVKEFCGEKYVAPWTKEYEEKELAKYYEKWIQPNLDIKRSSPLHDQLLLGQKAYPKMLGYASGYRLVNQYGMKRDSSTNTLMGVPSSTFVP